MIIRAHPSCIISALSCIRKKCYNACYASDVFRLARAVMTAEELRQFILSLPEVEEIDTWKEGHATFRVRDKIFATLSTDQLSAGVKASLDAQEMLISMDPETFSVAPYTGRFGWVVVRLSTVNPNLMHQIITDAWRRTAPKRLVATYNAKRSGT